MIISISEIAATPLQIPLIFKDFNLSDFAIIHFITILKQSNILFILIKHNKIIAKEEFETFCHITYIYFNNYTNYNNC